MRSRWWRHAVVAFTSSGSKICRVSSNRGTLPLVLSLPIAEPSFSAIRPSSRNSPIAFHRCPRAPVAALRADAPPFDSSLRSIYPLGPLPSHAADFSALLCTAPHRSALLPSLVRCSSDCEHSLALVSPVCSFSACMGICSATPSDRLSRLSFCCLPCCRCRCLHTHPIHSLF